jgi:hypothetical protein
MIISGTGPEAVFIGSSSGRIFGNLILTVEDGSRPVTVQVKNIKPNGIS